MKKKASKEQNTAAILTPRKTLMDELNEAEAAEQAQQDQQDKETCEMITAKIMELAKRFGFSAAGLWEQVLNGALDFRMVQVHGSGCDDGEMRPGTERLLMNTAGDCVIETATHSKFVSLRESAQWMAEMHARGLRDSSFDSDTLAEWHHLVAREMR